MLLQAEESQPSSHLHQVSASQSRITAQHPTFLAPGQRLHQEEGSSNQAQGRHCLERAATQGTASGAEQLQLLLKFLCRGLKMLTGFNFP